MWLGASHRRHIRLSPPSALVVILAFLNRSDPKLIPPLSMPPFSRQPQLYSEPLLHSTVPACSHTSSMSCVKPRLCQLLSHCVYCGWPRWLLGSLLVE